MLGLQVLLTPVYSAGIVPFRPVDKYAAGRPPSFGTNKEFGPATPKRWHTLDGVARDGMFPKTRVHV